MTRTCQYSLCINEIRESNSKEFIWCSYHEMEYQAFWRTRISDLAVPEEICRRIYTVQESCTLKEGAKILNCCYVVLSEQAKNGEIETLPDPRHPRYRRIGRAELIRLALERHKDSTISPFQVNGFEKILQELGEPKVPKPVAIFIFKHPAGCLMAKAERIFDFPAGTFCKLAQDGRIKVTLQTNRRQRYIMSQKEMIRIAQLRWGWVKTIDLARAGGLKSDIFNRYVTLGHFGRYSTDIFGNLCVREELASPANLRRVKAQYKKIAKGNKKNLSRRLDDGEYSPTELAGMVDISASSIRTWCRNGWLKMKEKKNTYAITKRDISCFLQLIETGQCPVNDCMIPEVRRLIKII